MNPIQFLVLLVIAAVCGALGQAIAGRKSRGGCLVSIALGLVGALLGKWLSGVLDLPDLIPLRLGGTEFPVVWAIIGAALFVAVLSLLTHRK